MSDGGSSNCPSAEQLKDKTEATTEVRNAGKEHSIPWRIKFLSCCIVDILTDDVTRLRPVDCKRDRISPNRESQASTHTL